MQSDGRRSVARTWTKSRRAVAGPPTGRRAAAAAELAAPGVALARPPGGRPRASGRRGRAGTSAARCRSRRRPTSEPDRRERRAPRARAAPAARGATRHRSRGFEHVAGLPHRLDQRRAERVELLAQVADVGLDDVRVAAEVVVPDVLEDLRLREHAARVEHEVAEQRELGRRQRDRRLAAEAPRGAPRRGRGRRSGARRRAGRRPSGGGSPATRATISARLNGFVT